MAQNRTMVRTQSLPVRTRLDSKLRRKARHQARKLGLDFEAPINESCASRGSVTRRDLASQLEGLYRQAVTDMDKRVHLKGKPRRDLNIHEFGRDVKSVIGYHDDNKPSARGTDKSARINKALKARRG